jgi:hypothetical protein
MIQTIALSAANSFDCVTAIRVNAARRDLFIGDPYRFFALGTLSDDGHAAVVRQTHGDCPTALGVGVRDATTTARAFSGLTESRGIPFGWRS